MNRMPTRANVIAKGPNEEGDAMPSEMVAFGRAQWTRKWRVFAGQFTQPQLMKLAFAVLKEQAVHSSQIYGFAVGKLRDPAPKVVLSIGILNLAIARSNGCKEAGDGPTCPGALAHLWKDKKWLVDDKGLPMGPVEVFLALTGQIDLHTDGDVDIRPEDQAAVSKSLGKYARTKLIELGIDFMDSTELEQLKTTCPVIEELIYNREVDAAQLSGCLADLALACEVEVEEIIDFAINPIVHGRAKD